MKTITKQEVLDSVPKQWADQYRGTKNAKHIEIGGRLNALKKPITKAFVDSIIGNTSWTRLVCDECKRDVDKVIGIGNIDRDEYAAINLCIDCLTTAVMLAREA